MRQTERSRAPARKARSPVAAAVERRDPRPRRSRHRRRAPGRL
ncbi:hypothetical protein GLA29479_3316 [Lysobacter antibioticus]|nr:hypothetical protein GLA29479_3316 [Lysobacter antibioticus]